MRKRALRDGRKLDFETFQAYGELKLDTLPGDYSIASESPVYINCCHRCLWYEGWKKYDLVKYGELYCRYIDINLVQGFSDEMVMIARTMLGKGDDCCTFVSVGYEQTEESKQRIAAMRSQLHGKYTKDFLYHLGHYLSALKLICFLADAVHEEEVIAAVRREFAAIYGAELTEQVWKAAQEDYDAID